MSKTIASDVLVIGGGLAGIVTAIECLQAGKSVTLDDRDSPERLDGLALWAFGGMALADTPLPRKMKIVDSPEISMADRLRFGELAEDDVIPHQWAKYDVDQSRSEVHDWMLGHGLKFMPAVNWVERGMLGDGNTMPRYHVVWGTSPDRTGRPPEDFEQAQRDAARLTRLLIASCTAWWRVLGGICLAAYSRHVRQQSPSIRAAASEPTLTTGKYGDSDVQWRQCPDTYAGRCRYNHLLQQPRYV